MIPWPHQTRGVKAVLEASMRGVRRIVLCAPTGAGKSVMMQMLAKEFLDRSGKVVLYANRKMLIEQISSGLSEAGYFHGVRAAGYEDEREHPFQVSSIQTEHSRVTKRQKWDLHAADLVLVDEGHLQTGNSARTILKAHHEAGALTVLVTASPLGMADMADELIVAATMSECRACGSLVPAVHYGADEPDMRAFKKMKEGEDPSQTEQRKAMMTPSIFGRVWTWYNQINQRFAPCLLFGPGVGESLWFAEQFTKRGIRAAHIDGADVWLDGKIYKSDEPARRAVREGSKDGTINVVCNRYVLREGIDWPWIEHIVMAFIAGSVQTYIQTLGRGLRAYPGKDHLDIQDHGGNYWRHGSINADREWSLEYTAGMAYGLRAERLRKKQIAEPFRCPQCGRVWTVGTTCLPAHGGCGFELGNRKRSRPVVGTDGVMHEMHGDIFRPRRISTAPTGPQLWEKMYYRSLKGKGARTFRAAMALFAYENNWGWPDPSWPFMPIEEIDHFRMVADVPRERLR